MGLADNMHVTRLCSIYLRDLLSLLPRKKVEALRRVSARLDDVYATYPTRRMPRRRLNSLFVAFGPPFQASPGVGWRICKRSGTGSQSRSRVRCCGGNVIWIGIERTSPPNMMETARAFRSPSTRSSASRSSPTRRWCLHPNGNPGRLKPRDQPFRFS